MTTSVQKFTFGAIDLRVVEIEGKPWFLATDVCAALGYAVTVSGVNHYLVGLGEGVDRQTLNARTLGISGGIRGNPMRCFISEAGLYRLIMRAHTERPEAARFQQWVTRDVLPAIRKDGAYVMGEEKALAAPAEPMHADGAPGSQGRSGPSHSLACTGDAGGRPRLLRPLRALSWSWSVMDGGAAYALLSPPSSPPFGLSSPPLPAAHCVGRHRAGSVPSASSPAFCLAFLPAPF